MESESREKRAKIIDNLVQEIIDGEIKRDFLINSANDFSGKTQAEYFSNSRYFLQNMVVDVVLTRSHNTMDLFLLNMIKGVS